MSTLAVIDGIRFFFYSEEGNEPAHVHIQKGRGRAKFWLSPLKQAYSLGLNPNEQRKIKKLLERNRHEWAERFEKRKHPAS